MSETTDIVVDTTRRIFRDLGDPQTIINAEGRDWAGPLWAALEEAGLTRAWVPEALGGADLSVTDTFALLREAGAHAVAVPLAETLLAAWTLAKAGIASGLPEDVAMRLARATVTGSGELARRSDESAEQLRRNVTSPGGTTLEALKVLMADDAIQPLFDRAIAAATARSRELAG